MKRLNSSMLLNDECLNTLARVLVDMAKQQNSAYALFSTFLPNTIQHCDDGHLWDITWKSEFWTKPTWMFPMHCRKEHHWVLVIVSHKQKSFYLFDSLSGSKRSWSENMKVSS